MKGPGAWEDRPAEEDGEEVMSRDRMRYVIERIEGGSARGGRRRGGGYQRGRGGRFTAQ